MRAPALAGALAALLLALTPRAAVPQAPPVFGATAELVLIDLVATDGDGRRVADLRADEIEVLEDGQPQRVEFVRYVTVEAAPEAEPTAAAPISAPAPAEAHAAPPRSQPPLSLVVVVDLRTLPADLLTPTRDAILGMVRGGLQPDMRLMLVVLDQGMEIRQAFTTDRTRFADAVLSLAPTSASEGAALADLVERVEVLCADLTIRNVDQQAVGIARAFVEDVRQGLSNTTDGLGALARYLAPLPGRKHVVFYSAGYPMQPQSIAASVVEALCYRGSPQGSGRSAMQAGPNEAHTAVRAGAAVDASGMLHALLDEANRSQVSIYTVDARGLVPDGVPGSQRAPTQVIRLGLGNPQQIQQRAVRDPQEILHSLAEGTGGVAALNTNDLARGLLAAARDGRGYYLVGYVPRGARKEGRFYPIALKVSRPGLQLRYRRGFEWLSEERRRDRAMSAALRFPKLFSDGGLTLDSWLEAGKLNVAALIPPRALAFRNEGGTFLSEIAVQGLLRDESGRVVGERYLFSKTVSLRLPAERHADLLTRDNLEIANQAPAPKKGRYLLSVVARHSGGRLATASLEFEVP